MLCCLDATILFVGIGIMTALGVVVLYQRAMLRAWEDSMSDTRPYSPKDG